MVPQGPSRRFLVMAIAGLVPTQSQAPEQKQGRNQLTTSVQLSQEYIILSYM